MMNTNHKLSKVQRIVWDIMKSLLPIIEGGNYKYYMLGGTLLGAVRHKGFIPWDDDIDIGMPRDDYERFLREVHKYLPDHLKLNTYWDDSPHHYYFSRIVDTRHVLYRKGSTIDRNEYVWIDIFPLDGMPNNPFIRRIHKLRLLYSRVRYHIATFDKVNIQRPDRPLTERIIIWLLLRVRFGINSNPRKWLDIIDKLVRKYSIQDTKWVCNFMGQYKFKEMFPKYWYGNGRMYEFEDAYMIGPVEYDKVLTQQYGNYMSLPKNKNTHAMELIK